MLNQLQPYIPLFQGYLLAKDPKKYLTELTDPTEKNILQLLSQDLHNTDDYREKAKKVGFNQRLQEALFEFKLVKHLNGAKEIKDDQIGRQIRRRFGSTDFDYPRPTTYTVNDPAAENQNRLPSSITVQQSLEHYLEKKLKERPEFIRNLNPYSISRISEKTLSTLPLAQQQYFLQRHQILSHLKPEFISKMLIQYEASKRNTNKNFTIPSNILAQLTKEQIDCLGRMKPDMFSNQAYVQIWFHFHYSQRINKYSQGADYLSKEQLDKKRQEFLEIIKELSHHTQHIIRAYVNRLKEEVFIIDLLVDDPSIERLIENLQNSYRISNVEQLRIEFIDEVQKRVRKDEASKYNPRMHSQLQMDRCSANNVIEDYIQKLFSINKDNTEYVKKLSPYFNQKYLRETNIKALLSQGIIPQNLNDYYNSQQLQQIKDKKQLRFHQTNRKKYKAEDKVQLQVSIKNVKTVHIKIYELSLQKHNLLYTGDIADDINLAFLKPTYEEIYEHQTKNAYAVDNVIIPVELQKKMGVFIVDLHGETITSRAVIRKGAILCLEDLTEAGQKFSFYDEEGRPLTQRQGLQVWMKDRPVHLDGKNFFEADYQQQAENIRIIASVGNYSQTFQKVLRNQTYRFDVGYLYNAQSFLVGKKAKVILYGRLLMNQAPMSLQLLKDIKTRATLTNFQNITSFYEYDMAQWMDDQDQIIEFPVQSYIQKITIDITAKIILQTKKDLIICSSKEISINLGEQKTNFMDFYLEKDKNSNYILNLLGLNGEPITNADVNLVYSINGVNEEESASAKTDSHGKINLGPLTIVKDLRAHISNSEGLTERLWSLYQPFQNINYSDNIHSKVGQVIVLPIDQRWTNKDILLFKLLEGYNSEDLSSKISIKDSTMHIPALFQGKYLLKILPIEKSMIITAMKDSKWQDDSQENMKIYDKINGKIVQIKQNIYQKIAIKGIKAQEQEDHNRVQIQISAQGLSKQHLEMVRVHVFANNFIAPVSVNLFKGQNYNTHPIVKETYLSVKDSTYYSNKTLSDEGAYVWNRQQRGQTIVGNNLDKPGIFLKRALVRDTKQEDEHLSESDEYIDECSRAVGGLRSRGIMIGDNQAKQLRSRNIQRVPSPLSSHNNFLLLSGFLKDNCKGTVLEVDIPKNYNQLQVYILTPSATIRKCFSLGEAVNRKLKDLRHAGIPNTKQNKAWTMSREIYPLAVGEDRVVNRDSQWRTVGLKQIFEFAKAKGCSLYEWSTHLLHWHSYSLPQKKVIYDKQCCHQLNTFLKFKDRQFFSRIVHPFILNKINKTFVDYCLLDDINAIRPYTSINMLQSLNDFQKCLLVFVLASQEDTRAEAQTIVKMIENQSNAVRRDYQSFKNRFDTIINAKDSIQQSPKISGKLQENRQKLVQMKRMRMCRMAQPQKEVRLDSGAGEFFKKAIDRRDIKMEEKKPFVPVESTKEYTERTYYNVKNYKVEAPSLITPSPFWAKLSRYLLQQKHSYFLSQQFMTLNNGIEFVLAASFVSSENSSNFDLQNQGEAYKIIARSPMLLYVKQVKELDFISKFGVQINQRFLDPTNMFVVEDGIRIQREVEEFVVKKPYIAQTVVTNTSGTPLQLQILLDIPKGSIPLQSHEYTQIVNVTLPQYTSNQFKRVFYIPEEGQYPIYPSNACKGSTIISKCKQLPKIIVKKYLTLNKLESFSDILRSGDRKAILNFIETKNIFDSNLFKPRELLWMLKDKDFYHQVVRYLRSRRYFDPIIWSFSFLHWDITSIREIVSMSMRRRNDEFEPAFFEYFPYYSTRTHRFANQSKSTIRNVQFKENYLKFLIGSIVNQTNQASSAVCFVYYLILQDRLREAQQLLKSVLEKYPNANQIQTDYMRCFLDMSLNTHNFAEARSILAKYKDYPLQSWAKLFDEVRKTLETEDEQLIDFAEGKKSQEFHTQVIQEIGQFKIIQPAGKTVKVQIFEINLELFFSESPFSQSTAFTSVKPSLVCVYDGSSQTKEIVVKRSDYSNIKDATVEITETSQGLPPKKVATFSWTNPEVKVKVNENAGTLQAFVSKKKQPGAYVKVFSKKDGKEAFYRDGYTDMTGTFRYAMSDLGGITEFSILVQTSQGGSTVRVKPPSKIATY